MKIIILFILNLIFLSCKENMEKNLKTIDKFIIKTLEESDSSVSKSIFDLLNAYNESKLNISYKIQPNRIISIKEWKKEEDIVGVRLSNYGDMCSINNFVLSNEDQTNLRFVEEIKSQAVQMKCTKVFMNTHGDPGYFQEKLGFRLEGKIDHLYGECPLYILSIRNLDTASNLEGDPSLEIVDSTDKKYEKLNALLAKKSKAEKENILGKYNENVAVIYAESTNGEIIGGIELLIYGKVAYGSLLVVHPDFRKQHLASRLIKKAEDYIKSKKEIDTVFFTTQGFQKEARKLYEKEGFEAKLVISNRFFNYGTTFMMKKL